MEADLLDWHRSICRVTGQLAYALYRRRVPPSYLIGWAETLEFVAQAMRKTAERKRLD